jgi:hypothetical protein
MKKLACLVAVGVIVASVASAEWHYGIGTGIRRLNAKGDVGVNTRLAGPVVFDLDLDPDDFSDLMETAFGLGAFATDGTWTLQFSGGFLELVDDATAIGPRGNTVAGEFTQEITVAELSLAYTALRDEKLVLKPYVGVRYLKHEYDIGLSITGAGGTVAAERDIESDWTDVRIGLGIDVPLAKKWVWGSSVEAGFGGSDGTYKGNTGVNWMFADHWMARLDFDYLAIDFEDGDPTDEDYYLYDADEFGSGLSVMYLW